MRHADRKAGGHTEIERHRQTGRETINRHSDTLTHTDLQHSFIKYATDNSLDIYYLVHVCLSLVYKVH
jgi:hypothetical protein